MTIRFRRNWVIPALLFSWGFLHIISAVSDAFAQVPPSRVLEDGTVVSLVAKPVGINVPCEEAEWIQINPTVKPRAGGAYTLLYELQLCENTMTDEDDLDFGEAFAHRFKSEYLDKDGNLLADEMLVAIPHTVSFLNPSSRVLWGSPPRVRVVGGGPGSIVFSDGGNLVCQNGATSIDLGNIRVRTDSGAFRLTGYHTDVKNCDDQLQHEAMLALYMGVRSIQITGNPIFDGDLDRLVRLVDGVVTPVQDRFTPVHRLLVPGVSRQ